MARGSRFGAVSLAALAALVGAGAAAQQDVPLETDDAKAFYAFGANLGGQLESLGLSPEEFEAFSRGMRDAALARPLALDPQDYAEHFEALRQARLAAKGQAEREASAAYVAKAAAEPGATQTDSGLVFTELAAGSGASPDATNVVKVHYHGVLRDGTVFDSTRERQTPAEFPLNRVIPCWREGLPKMRVGGRARLVCPPEIAYGDRGFPPGVPPGAVLDFEIELLEIVK